MASKREKCGRDQEYDWLNDPFDEKKAAEEREQASMSTASKLAIGGGCLAIAAGLVLMLFVGVAMLGVLS